MYFSNEFTGALLVLVQLVHLHVADGVNKQNEPEVGCVRRTVHSDQSFLCVCNATYCDELAPPQRLPQGQLLAYTTSKNEHRFHETVMNFRPDDNDVIEPDRLHMRVNDSDVRQEIQGFGGSFTDATGFNVLSLSTAAQQRLMDAYFSNNGLEYNMARVPIGGTDFSTRPYTYGDGYKDDFQLEHFQLQPEDVNYKIPLIKRAKATTSGDLRLVGTTWSPPAWMKINNQLSGFGWLKGPVGGKYYDTYAQYHIRFLEEYAKDDIDFWALTPVNEPVSGLIPFYPFNCLGFTPNQLKVFVNQNLGPVLKQSRFNETLILIYDLGRILLQQYVDAIMSGEHADEYVDGIALHWYHDTVTSVDSLDRINRKYPSKFLLMTESSIVWPLDSGPAVLLGSWKRAEVYAFLMIRNMQHWVTGWIDWNMALNEMGGPAWDRMYVDALVIVNATNDEFYKQPMYYVMAHFSKFVPRGSHVVGVSSENGGGGDDVTYVAYLRPDFATVLVVLNKKDSDVAIRITDPAQGSVNATVPSRSVQTYIWWKQSNEVK